MPSGPFSYNPRVPFGGSRELRSRPPGSWVAKLASLLDRAAFRPASLPDDLVTAIALGPPIVAGLVIFKAPAAQMLAIALAAGAAGLLASRWVLGGHHRAAGTSTIIAAIFGVALVGPGAAIAVSVEIAVLAVVLELLRLRYLPAIRAQAGIIAYAAIALATRGGPFAYINPASGASFGDPLSTWYQFFSAGSAPIDPIRLYVGNVPGPVFATSLLAVAVGVAWLAYARRVSLVVLVGFLVGALVAIYTLHWDPLFHLDSGPLWFVAGLVLADRRLLPDSWAVRPTLGLAVGLFAVGLRRPPEGSLLAGHGLELGFFSVALVQAAMAIVVVVIWSMTVAMERLKRTRRLRQREANLRVVKPISRAS